MAGAALKTGPTKAAVAHVDAGVPLTRDGLGPTLEEWLWYWHDYVKRAESVGSR